jgi:hypothetical protein
MRRLVITEKSVCVVRIGVKNLISIFERAVFRPK